MSSIFTQIINGEIPCYKIYEDDKTLAFLDIHPETKGHVLVIPKIEIDKIYDLPDEEVMGMYNQTGRMWEIDPNEYGLESDDLLRLYLPTLEKDINIKQWAVNRYQERQIKEFKRRFESWDIDTFKFYDDVITNIIVTPNTRLIQRCPVCGEEVTSLIRFPNGASSLFNVQSKFKKFGKK